MSPLDGEGFGGFAPVIQAVRAAQNKRDDPNVRAEEKEKKLEQNCDLNRGRAAGEG